MRSGKLNTSIGAKGVGMFLRKNWMWILVVLGTLAAGISGCGESGPVSHRPGGLQLGDQAPDFALVSDSGQVMRLSDVKPGWFLVLVFYRGHWCSACQNQLLNLKEDFAKFAPLHAALAAVSVDTVEESADFNHLWHFPFPLLSDTRFQLIDAYGIRDPHGHEGKDISRPSVVIIDPRRIIRYKYVGVSPLDRPEDDEILYILQRLQEGGASRS